MAHARLPVARDEDNHLTHLELELLHLWSQGHRVKDIAALQHRSPQTIDNRFRRIREKLEVKFTDLAVIKAIQNGFLQLGA